MMLDVLAITCMHASYHIIISIIHSFVVSIVASFSPTLPYPILSYPACLLAYFPYSTMMMRTSFCGVAVVRQSGFGPWSRLLSASGSSSSSVSSSVTTTTRAASSFSLPVTSTATTSLQSQQQQQQQQQHSRRSHYTYSSPGQYSSSHPHDADGNHSHNGDNGDNDHSHDDKLAALWKDRDFTRRGFTVGIGGPVGSGKTALVLQLCLTLVNEYEKDINTNTNTDINTDTDTLFLPSLAVVTNDIFTQEDGEFLVRQNALPAHKIRAVETGGCPHAAIREDVSANLAALEDLTKVLHHRRHR
jgi:hypothetical protein